MDEVRGGGTIPVHVWRGLCMCVWVMRRLASSRRIASASEFCRLGCGAVYGVGDVDKCMRLCEYLYVVAALPARAMGGGVWCVAVYGVGMWSGLGGVWCERVS